MEKCANRVSIAFDQVGMTVIPIVISTTYIEKHSCYANESGDTCCDGPKSDKCKETQDFKFTGYKKKTGVFDYEYSLEVRKKAGEDTVGFEYVVIDKQTGQNSGSETGIAPMPPGAFGGLSWVPDCKNNDADNDTGQTCTDIECKIHQPCNGGNLLAVTQHHGQNSGDDGIHPVQYAAHQYQKDRTDPKQRRNA